MKAVKFTFDTHFEGRSGQPRAAEKRARKSYTAEEIDAMVKHAHEEGRTEGTVREAAALTATVGQLAAAVFQSIRHMDAEVENIRNEAAQLAFVTARKLAGAALDAAPQAVIQEALHEALRHAVGEPRVIVRVAPLLVREIERRVADIAAAEGFEGRITIVADAGLKSADCRMEWGGGGTEHSMATIESALAGLIARRFTPTQTPAPSAQTDKE